MSFLIIAEFQLEIGKLFQTMPRLEKQWYLSFDIKPTGIIATDAAIIHASSGHFHQRIPSIHFKRGTLKLFICMILGVSRHSCFTESNPLSTKYFTNVKLVHSWDTKMEKYLYKVYINGELKHSDNNGVPLIYKNVKVWAANPWLLPAKALVKNLVLVNIQQGKELMLILMLS